MTRVNTNHGLPRVHFFPDHTHPWVMERTNLAHTSEQFSLGEPFGSGRRLYDEDEELLLDAHNEGVHLASIAEKKHLWWRNAIINTLFIASWYVSRFFSFVLGLAV